MADGKLFKAFADTSPYPSMPAPEPGGPMAEMGELMRMDAELDATACKSPTYSTSS